MGFWNIALPIAGFALDALGQHSANKQNARMAREQMAFQERMSSTEIQRRTQDLLAAGMNPMLAVSQGGASSGPGARAEVQSVTGRAVGTALAIRAQQAQLDQMQAQTRLLEEQRTNVRADTNLKGITAINVAGATQHLDAQVQRIAQEVKNLQATYDLTTEQINERRLTNAQLAKMQPLLLAYQEAVNQGLQLGLTQKQIDEKFARELGEESKWIRFIRDIVGASNPRSN